MMLNIDKKKLDTSINDKINSVFQTNSINYSILDKKLLEKYNFGKDCYCYEIPGLTIKLDKYLDNISESGETYKTVFNKINNNDIYIIGDTIRALFSTSETPDINLSFSSTVQDVQKICDINDINCYLNEDDKYVKFYSNIDAIYDKQRLFNTEIFRDDYTVNTVVYDMTYNILITFSKYTLNDLIYKIIRISPELLKSGKWIDDWKNPLKYFSLISHSYTSIDEEQEQKILNYINLYFKDVYCKNIFGYPAIKYYIIKYITCGDIINDNIYYYGYNINNLIKYLDAIKLKDKKLYNKINNIIVNNNINNNTKFLQISNRNYQHIITSTNYKVYMIDKIKNKYEDLLTQKTDLKDTFSKLFQQLFTVTNNIYIYGGWVRDSLLDINFADVEIAFDSDVKRLRKLCSKNRWPCSKIIEKHNYIMFGKERGLSIEGIYKLHILSKESINYDYTVNNLVYDIANDVIIDLTGFGIIDLFNKKIRLPVPPSKYITWATSNWKKPLIYFKLMIKGFTPIDAETEYFIINYIETNFEEIYMQKINGIPAIVFYLVDTLTHGGLNKDGTFFFGPTKERLIPYLHLLNKYLKADYFNQINDILINGIPKKTV